MIIRNRANRESYVNFFYLNFTVKKYTVKSKKLIYTPILCQVYKIYRKVQRLFRKEVGFG